MIKVEFASREQAELVSNLLSVAPLKGDLNALLAATQILNDARARINSALREHAKKNGGAVAATQAKKAR
jgi:hypothetical protein